MADFEDYEDDALTGHEHEKLLTEIRALNKKPKKESSSGVLKTDNLVDTAATGKVQLRELLDSLQSSSLHPVLKKQINKLKSKTLKAPPSKPAQLKIERSVVYEKVSKEVKVWEPIVKKNRRAKQLEFPLQKPDLRIIDTTEKVKQAKPMTQLEKEIAMARQGSRFNIAEKDLLAPEEEKQLLLMNLEEAKEHRAKLKRHHALVSHKVAQNARKKKIKSKRYHRMLRHKELKREKKRLQELKEKDPKAFQDELEKMDMKRIEERASLRHRGGSKKLKQKALFGKYNAEARQAIQDMIDTNRQLTQKVREESESSSGDEDEDEDQDKVLDIESMFVEEDDDNEEKLVVIQPKDNPVTGVLQTVPIAANDDDDDELQDFGMDCEETFAADDVVEEFEATKKSIAERDRVQDIDLTLPGWGSWAGAGIDPAKTRRTGVIIKAPKHQPRKDDKLKHVILSENKDETIRKHQVNTLPYPYNNVHSLQKAISDPVGKLWNPETIYRNKIAPKITSQLGTIIPAMDRSQLLNMKGKDVRSSKRKR